MLDICRKDPVMVRPVRKRDNREGRGEAEIGEGGEKRQWDDDLDGDKENKG